MDTLSLSVQNRHRIRTGFLPANLDWHSLLFSIDQNFYALSVLS
jgi:hypothetical protein